MRKKADIQDKLKAVRMLIMDVDGVLTDGGIIFGSESQEFKIFNIQDGMGITLARMGGLKVGIITGRKSDVMERRAKELRVDVLYQGNPNKIEPYEQILDRFELQDVHICYVGDDLLDVLLMKRVGVAVAVANARDEVKKIADFVTCERGGKGAIREVVELLLKSQNKWPSVLENIFAHPQ